MVTISFILYQHVSFSGLVVDLLEVLFILLALHLLLHPPGSYYSFEMTISSIIASDRHLNFKLWQDTLPDIKKKSYVHPIKTELNNGTFIIFERFDRKFLGRIVKSNFAYRFTHNDKLLAGEDESCTPDMLSTLLKVNIYSVSDHSKEMLESTSGKSDERSTYVPVEVHQTAHYLVVHTVAVTSIAFVFHEDDFKSGHYSISFMRNSFICKSRQLNDEKKTIQPLKPAEVIPFPWKYPNYSKWYSAKCYASSVWYALCAIRKSLQLMLCRQAKSQGTTNSRCFLFPSEAWDYLKMEMNGLYPVITTRRVKEIHLEDGLTFFAEPVEVSLETLTISTYKSICLLRSVVGGAAVGYGVRKPRPNYSATPEKKMRILVIY